MALSIQRLEDTATGSARVQNVKNVKDLRQARKWLREEIADYLQVVALREAQEQSRANNPLSSVVLDGRVRVNQSGSEAITVSQAKGAIERSTRRVQLLFQGDMKALETAMRDTWRRLLRRTPRDEGEARKTFYIIGRANGRFTGRMGLEAATTWVRKQTDPLTSVRIEGPQTPYRRKLLYLYANTGRKRGATEWLRKRGSASGKSIFDERAEFRPATQGGKSAFQKRSLNLRVNKPYMKTIAEQAKRRYRGLWIGYRFVPANEPLKAYKSRAGLRPWGRNLPQIYIGMKPGASGGGANTDLSYNPSPPGNTYF